MPYKTTMLLAFRHAVTSSNRVRLLKIARIYDERRVIRTNAYAGRDGDCVRDAHTHDRARQLSLLALARSLTRCEECACRKGTNSQVSADDGHPAVRGVVAKPDRGTNGSCFKALLGKMAIKNANSIFVKVIDIYRLNFSIV